MPRWLVVLGAGGGVAIVVALLRYAVDLLGLVSIIILVGFSIRTITDWLTDTESVSGWSLVAVLAGAFGTAAAGVWLFGSAGSDGVRNVERWLPPGFVRGIDWAEDRGWGGRVLLPDTRASRAPSAGRASAIGSDPRSGVGSLRPRGSLGGSARPTDRDTPAAGRPAPPPPEGSTNQVPPPTRGAVEQYPTATSLSVDPARSVVGLSVRLTAVVVSHTGAPLPEGTVVFRRRNVIVGSATLRPDGSRAVARVSTVDLPVGTHELVAEYVGGGSFVMSRSSPVVQTVVRD